MCIQLQPGSAVLTWLWRLPGGRSLNWAGSPAGGEPAEGAWIVRAEAGPTRSWKSREGVNLRNGGSWTQCGRWVYGWVEEMEARSLSLIRGCRWTSCLRSQCSSVLCPENVLDLIPGKFQRLRAGKGGGSFLRRDLVAHGHVGTLTCNIHCVSPCPRHIPPLSHMPLTLVPLLCNSLLHILFLALGYWERRREV